MNSTHPHQSASRRSLTAVVFVLILGVSLDNQSTAAETVSYSEDVLPILNQFCVGCHTKDDPEGGYVMETYSDQVRGGVHGVAITPGSASSSRLLLMLQGKLAPTMPPNGEPRPSSEQIETLVTWVEQGALGPEGPPQLKRMLKTPNVQPLQDLKLPVTAVAATTDHAITASATYGRITINKGEGDDLLITDELNKINSLAFSQDGKKLLVASGRTGAFGTATVYSVDTGERLIELTGHRDVLFDAIFSPNDKLIATAGYDAEIIAWDALTGEPLRTFTGHNGAIFDIAFSSDGELLFSGSADETIKIWNVETGARLVTLGQPEGEVLSLTISKDDRFLLAGGNDQRVRIWSLSSTTSSQDNQLIATRFVDESAVTHLEFTDQGRSVVAITEGGNIKLLDAQTWNLAATLDPVPDSATCLQLDPSGKNLTVHLMNGENKRRTIPSVKSLEKRPVRSMNLIYLDLGSPTSKNETELETHQASWEANPGEEKDKDVTVYAIPRNAEITGSIHEKGQRDYYRWNAKQGEQWAIDVDAVKDSRIDPIVTILDANLNPVLRTRLQATRESYFTFRGKDSMQVGDFRLFNWENMHLDDYLYSGGEVTRLWLYPRGPDSGYNVYPNEGQRWTYFGTSQTTHALGEPAYVVRPLGPGEEPTANGLPTFNIFYENDDDPRRRVGKNSRLTFSCPADSEYHIRITDTRGMGGDQFGYIARVRPASPGFIPTINQVSDNIHRGTGREFTVRIDRLDGFDGEVSFDIPDLPKTLISNLPLTIEEGQRFATGCLWLADDSPGWEGTISPDVIATATILGKQVERNLGPVGKLTVTDRPNVIPMIQPIEGEVSQDAAWTLKVRRGATVMARVIIDRKEGFDAEVSFGKEDSGRNSPHGVYVDNIGLNGLLVRKNELTREFFITADPIAKVGKRWFHLRTGGVTTRPILLEVLP